MADAPMVTPPRRKSDVGLRTWTESSGSPAFSPLQRLRQGPTFQPPRRSSHSWTNPNLRTEVSDERTEGPDASEPAALEQEIAGLQKVLATESRRESREHFAVRRRLHQLQNVQAKQVHPSDAPKEAADELEKVKAALEELRRGGEEEKIHRSQLEERVMREIEDLKSPASPVTPSLALTRSLSRQNLLAEERERKRFWANEQLHAEVQELQDTLAELRVNCADEMEAQRLKEHEMLAASAEMKEQLSLAPAREEALMVQLAAAEDRCHSELAEVQQLRRDVREQDEALASFWGLQSSYTREAAEATRYREATCNLQEEIQSLSKAEMRESGEVEEELQQQVERLRSQLLPLEEKMWLRETQDLQAYQAVSSSLKQLPQSFQDELGAPEDAPLGTSSTLETVRSEWCSSTIQKLASFASSVLAENAQLRWNLDLAQAKGTSPRSQASADEAGGHGVEVKKTSTSESALNETAQLREAEAKAEAKVKILEKRLAKYEKSSVTQPGQNSHNGTAQSSRLRSKLPESKSKTSRETTSPLKRRSPEVKSSEGNQSRESDRKSVALPAESLKADGVPSSCLYNSDSSSSGPPRGAYPPSPDSVSCEPPTRWMGPFTPESQQLSEKENGTAAANGSSKVGELSNTTAEPPKIDAATPQSAADLFARAEALCESQHFAEAAELFRCVLAALRASADREQMRSVEAEVWAHLGVAMQSLDDIAAAIESYCQAVRMDPSLHVCFANLATLHMYLEDFQKAEEHISRALELEPQNQAYLEIKASMRHRSARAKQ